MAQIFNLSLHIVKLPDDTIPAGVTSAGIIYGIDMRNWEAATACSAANTASYPGAATQISVVYYVNGQQYTGSYLVVETLSAIQTAATAAYPNYLQTVNVVQLTNGNAAPGSGGGGTAYIINNAFNMNITAATATDIVNYPNALTRLQRWFWSQSQLGTGTMIVTQATAAVIAAS